MQADELRLPTLAVPVTLTIGPHEPRTEQGELFVGERGDVEALTTLLESDARFLPFRTKADPAQIRLVAKAAIIHARIPVEPPGDEPEVVLYDRQHRVEVHLVQGERVEGLLFDSSPGSHPRAIDHLNSASAFLRLWTARECVLIAKAQIATVTELAEPVG